MSDRRQRQKEQRAAKREAERKRDSRRELLRRIGTSLVFGVVVVGIFALGGLFGNEKTDLPASYENFRNQETACGAETPPPEKLMSFQSPEDQVDITSSSSVTATLDTSCGPIVIELNNEQAPETVNSFVFLARQGFYDGQVIYRIAPDFVIETGDPDANGTGGAGYTIAGEPPPEDFLYDVGVVAMDNQGAGSTRSAFWIVTGSDARFLTSQFNVLGTVTSGQDNIDRIKAIKTATAPGSVEKSLPLESVYINSIDIEITDS